MIGIVYASCGSTFLDKYRREVYNCTKISSSNDVWNIIWNKLMFYRPSGIMIYTQQIYLGIRNRELDNSQFSSVLKELQK